MGKKQAPKEIPVEAAPLPASLEEDLVKVDVAMSLLGVKRTKIYLMMKKGLPHYKMGRNLLFLRSELVAYRQGQKVS